MGRVAALQDVVTREAGSGSPFAAPAYDKASQDRTRDALLTLQRDLNGFDHSFGRADEVDPVRHLLGLVDLAPPRRWPPPLRRRRGRQRPPRGDPGRPNRVEIVDGWNYLVRLYRPCSDVLDGTWTFPKVQPA